MTANALCREGVTFRYAPEGAPVLDDLSLAVRRGEFVAVIGPSGSGKSTLLNLVAGLLEPDDGRVALDGDSDAARLGRVGYMQQRDLLVPWRSVEANAALGLELRGTPRDEVARRVRECAEVFGLVEVLGKRPGELSGGMRQRAALMRTVLTEPDLLLLDEPFGALDAITRGHLQRWLLEMVRRYELTAVLVSHDIDEVLLLADRVAVMSRGGRLAEELAVDRAGDAAAAKRRLVELLGAA